jgi:ERCC4-type nuclease
MLVQISDKEQDRIPQAQKYFEKELKLETEVTNLKYGDYLFNNQVIFEYKTIADFIASIQDNRVFNEAINQAENYNYHYIIIQGNEAERAKQISISKNYQPITIYQYHGAIASINRYSTVIESYTPWINEAFYKMYIQAKKDLSQKPIVKKFPRKHKNACFNYLAYCVYGVSAKRATDICHYLDIHTLEDLLNITHQQLTSIDGIGEKLADRIITTISNDTYES